MDNKNISYLDALPMVAYPPDTAANFIWR